MAETNDVSSSSGGTAGRKIPKAEFLKMARDYRDQRLNLIAQYGNNQNDSRSCYYSRDMLEELLSTNCTGIRIYYGVRTEPSDGKHYTTLMLTGVSKNNITGAEELVMFDNGVEGEEAIVEWGSLCPPDAGCEENILLNEIDLG